MLNMDPEKMPAEAKPAIARPMMKTTELGAAPQMVEPISKTTKLMRNVLLDTLGADKQNRAVTAPGCFSLLPLHVVELVDAAVYELSASSRQHVGGAIPANVSQGLELVRDAWYGSRENGAVQSDEEQAKEITENYRPELDRLRLEEVRVVPAGTTGRSIVVAIWIRPGRTTFG